MSDVVQRAREVLDGIASKPNLAATERYAEWLRDGGPGQLLAEVERARSEADHWKALWRQNTETASEAMRERDAANAEAALLRDGINVRPMTEVESNLMTQVLDLRRQLAASRERDA